MEPLPPTHSLDEVLEVPHGWIAFISDPEGNVLQIYQAKEGND